MTAAAVTVDLHRGLSARTFSVFATIVCGLTALPAVAQLSVEFDVQPKVVRLGDMVTATFTISGVSDPPTPALPSLPDFRVSSRPSIGTQTVIRNGRVNSSRTFTYQMMPTKAGTFRIGPIDYSIKNQRISIPAVELQVAPSEAARSPAAQRLDDLLFARLLLDDDSLYVQENTEVVLSVYYSDLRLGRDIQLSGLPASGLSFQSFRDMEGDREMVNGRIYEVRRFRSVLRGLTAGSFTISPKLTLPIYSSAARSRRSSSVFDSFFFRDLMSDSQSVEIRTPPVTVTIQPLPDANRPLDFSGAVGEFQFDARAQPLAVKAGDPVTLTMDISGRGNLDIVSAPPVDLGPAFRLYDARLVSKQINETLTYGRKTFEQVIIPRDDAIDAVPEVTFSYFDPESAEYRTLRQGPFRLTVAPNEAAAARVIQAPPPPSDRSSEVDVLEADIAYLKADPGTWRNARRRPWYAGRGFWVMQTIPPLLSVVAFVVARRRDGLVRDQARSRRARAPRELAARMRLVEEALAEGRHREFYECIWLALSGYLGDRLNLPPGSVAEPIVTSAFQQAGMPPGQVKELRHVFELCEQARFGFGPSDESVMTDSDRRSAGVILEKLRATIHHCDKVRM